MKLVKESLDKYRFERKSNSLSSLGVGQRYLIEKWLDRYGIKNYIINDDYTIDVEGDVDLSKKGLVEFPNYIKFREVKGSFYCDNNQLATLEGCPTTVKGSFYCSYNQLTTLQGCPKEINGDFDCYNNQLTTLEGCPKIVNRYFYCRNNKVKFRKEYVRSLCKVKRFIYNI